MEKEEIREFGEEWVITQGEENKDKLMKKKRKRADKKSKDDRGETEDVERTKKSENKEENMIILNDAFNLTEEEKRKCKFN